MPLFSVLCPPWLLHPLPGLVALTQAFAYPAPHIQKDQSPAQLALHPAIPCMASGSLFNDSFTENIPWLLRLSVTFIIDPPPFSLILFLPHNMHLSLQLPISHLTPGLTYLITTVSKPLFTLPNRQKEVLNKYQLNE